MGKGKKAKSRGFTIIETTLVLAIAGLIFLIAFIALPALQRSQQNARRREDVSTLVTALKKYQTNNRGALPDGNSATVNWPIDASASKTSWAGFYRDYLGEKFRDPFNEYYVLSVAKCTGSGTGSEGSECSNGNIGSKTFPNGYKIVVLLNATCSGSSAVYSSNPRKLAALYKLDGGGVFCSNS